VAVVQVEYTPFDREIEGPESTNLLATCRELGVGIVCHSPLGRGLLTGTLTTKESITGAGDLRAAAMPRFIGENFDANVRIVAGFKELADKKGCTPAQLALAWLLKQGEDVIPIPGTRKMKYLEENLGALNVELSSEDEAEIRKFLEMTAMAGSRMPEEHASEIFVDTKEES
jgi:aryl-alcohol dehydrogenase-like predicted oxidoreductase